MSASQGRPEVPRFVPEEPLPPYAYVPGRSPHPVSDPAGHSYNAPRPRPAAPDPDDWAACREYLYGVDLFNRGYYWEAHEVWEGLWHACGRRGVMADFLKGLIRLAAAGVKAYEGKPEGVRSHTRAARRLFEQVARERGAASPSYLGLSLDALIRHAAALADQPDAVLRCVLVPGQAGHSI
jgi:uncharacterized protein